MSPHDHTARIVDTDAGAPGEQERNRYDELPYRSLPVEWSAPERLALCSVLHGGPRVSLKSYRVLELGCGDGANLIALAYYRRHARFVGVDGSAGAIARARARCLELGLQNVHFEHADFGELGQRFDLPFDFILAHGVFSWVSHETRDSLLSWCKRLLSRAGLLYLNYNTKPGWNVRGMVREFLLSQTAHASSLAERTRLAQEIAASMAGSMATQSHPYMQLMANEYRFVCDAHPSYVAHEFLAEHNHAYWRSEFLELSRAAGFQHVADADFNYESGRIAPTLPAQITAAGLGGPRLDDTIDLLSYRQLHSPVFTHHGEPQRSPGAQEFSELFLACELRSLGSSASAPWRMAHPTGREVEIAQKVLHDVLAATATRWPAGGRIGALFGDVTPWLDDLVLLHRYAMIELRMPGEASPPSAAELNAREWAWGGYRTSPFHRCEF
ncbi:MAG: class I SAM-dependent methyltransferase [Myxococcales bacterium]